MKNRKKAFTIVEIVVAATILVVLTSIGFYSYTKNISHAKDSTRKSDLLLLSSQLSLQKKKKGAYPHPDQNFLIKNGTFEVARQWKMSQNVGLATSEKIPLDPELKIPYTYSTTHNRQEYQLAGTLENSDSPQAIVVWDYKSVAKNVLPSIVLATGSISEIDIALSRDLFILNDGYHTLPYDFETQTTYSDGTSFSWILDDAKDSFFQNSDYQTCEEISLAAKRITADGHSDEYQIRSSTGALTNQVCECSSTGCSAA